jgi:MFS transporter, DHA3 family, macrolide efflux protein
MMRLRIAPMSRGIRLCIVCIVTVLLSRGFLYVNATMGFLIAANSVLLNAHWQAIWQAQTPRELQGRVFSVRRLIAQFTRPIGTAAAGWLAGPFDPGYLLAAIGSVVAAFCLVQLFNPYLLRVEDKAWLDQLAIAKD